jgi:hypothetical protein
MLGDVLCYDCKYCIQDDEYEDEFGCPICDCKLPNHEASQSWHKCDDYEREKS